MPEPKKCGSGNFVDERQALDHMGGSVDMGGVMH